MEEKVRALVGDKLNPCDLWIDSVIYEKEGGENYLRIVLDANRILNLSEVVMATRIINPLLDKEKNGFLSEEYILDVYAKSKDEGEI